MLYKLSLLLATCAITTGCYQTVNSWDIERAAKVCNSVENIIAIHAHAIGHESVQCRDGNKHMFYQE